MKIKTVIAFTLVILLLLSAFVACKKDTDTPAVNDSTPATSENSNDGGNTDDNGNGGTQSQTPPAETKKPAPTEPTLSKKVIEKVSDTEQVSDTFLPVGRTYIANSGLACDFAGTGLRFTADCQESVFVKIASEKNVYFTVYVDGEREDRVLVKKNSEETWVSIAEELEKGVHEIEIVKQSQFTQSNVQILEVGVIGAFGEAPEERDVFIEFYGDSIVNGSNIFGGGTSTSSTDVTSAFAWLAARELNADCSIIGCGGLGLVSSNVPYVMNDVWNKNGLPASAGEYGFTRIPDIVVIELGVNDAAHGTADDTEEYRAAVRELIANIREKYGSDVPIIWLYGYYETENWENTEDIIYELRNTDKNLYACEMPESNAAPEDGGDGIHPSETTTKPLTESLVEALEPLFVDRDGMYGAGDGDNYAEDYFG